MAVLRPLLERARPSAYWDDDEKGSGTLGRDEWWETDAAAGNVNHVHGTAGWVVTATLIRDDEPVLTAVNPPLTGETYSAARGHGAFVNGERRRRRPRRPTCLMGTAPTRSATR